MTEKAKTLQELDEISILKSRITELEQAESMRMRMEEELQRNRANAERLTQERAIIAQIGRKIGSILSIEEVFEQLAAESQKLIPHDRLAVTLIKPESGTFTVAYVAGLNHPERKPGSAFPLAGSATEAVQRTRSGIIAQAGNADEISRIYPYITILQMSILSLMTVPLIAQDRVIGALNFRSRRPNAYTEQDLRLAEGIGREIAGAIANADLFDRVKSELEERRRAEQEMAILADVGRLISSTPDIEEVYERFAREVRKFIPCDRISVDLNDPAEETFSIAYVSGFDIPGRRPGDVVSLKGSITDIILRTRTGLLINQASLEEINRRFPGATNITTVRAGMRSLISVPLISRDEVIGTLHLRAKKANAYTERDLLLAEKIGMQIAGAIANAQLFNALSKTEQSLRESNELFSLVMNHSPIYAYIKEVTPTESRVLQASENFKQMIGIPGSAMVGRTMAELFPPDFALKITADDWCVVTNGNVLTLDEELNGRSYTTIKFPIILGDRDLVAGYTMDITERKRADEALQDTLNLLESRVRERTIELEEINTALRVLLKKGEQDQKNLEEILQSNVNQLVMPFLHKLRTTLANKEFNLSYLNILEANLANIVSPFINQLSASFKNLTPREIQIAELIKQGKRSKEIAEFLGVSVGTVITHRNNIRKKLNLKSKGVNLTSHLLSRA